MTPSRESSTILSRCALIFNCLGYDLCKPLGVKAPQDGELPLGISPEVYGTTKETDMDIYNYLSAAQVADLEAFAKALEELRKTKLPAMALDLSSHTIDPTLLNRVW
jgi:hypothetical protein